MLRSDLVLPDGADAPYDYAPMGVAIEIMIGPHGQIGDVLIDSRRTTRRWLPDLPRTSGIAPILGSDKLDYYHPTRKPKNYEAMLNLLAQYPDIEPLQWIAVWMQSDAPIALDRALKDYSKTDLAAIESGRIVWRLADGGYIHDLPAVQAIVNQGALERVIQTGDGRLRGTLPKAHNRNLPAPLFGCNTPMFRSWGQSDEELEVDAIGALQQTRYYTAALEAKSHHLHIADGRYWVWLSQTDTAAAGLGDVFDLDAMIGANDPIEVISGLIEQVNNGAKFIKSLPEKLSIVGGYIGMGGSGVGRVAIGQMTEYSLLSLLQNLMQYHQQQLRHVPYSKPFWAFAPLIAAEGVSSGALARAKQQLFEAMLYGQLPPKTVTRAIVQRLQVEGVPRRGAANRTNREWGQLAYLAWLAPDVIATKSITGDTMPKPNTTPDNLFAWHVGRVFANCRALAYNYAARGGTKPGNDWRNPMDSYRQRLFSAPAQALPQILAKVSAYLGALPAKQYGHKVTLQEMSNDCPGMVPPQRWNDEQAYFLALGMSELLQSDTEAMSTDGHENDG
ncbi:MAG: hypothetical protein B0A82_20070 [Alkalinema sp. CACIAM 70d]|nr:MAG: hypothetical protein B0A82_20070 [Alkalinema sp. CACIAM 70d]